MVRQFKLWNKQRTNSFDFTTNKCIITDVSGFGISFKSVINNNTVVDHNREFDEISMLVNFGVGSNAYTSFNQFASFVLNNGINNFVLEYSFNGRTVYADVWLKRMPKSQKTIYNVLSETILFTRMSHWYQIETGVIPEEPGYVTITNNFFEDILLDIVIFANTSDDFRIVAKDTANEIISQIIISNQLTDGTLTIMSEEKYVDRFSAGVHSNGYNLISRDGDTFLLLEQGEFRLSTNQSVTTQPQYTYKKWVID